MFNRRFHAGHLDALRELFAPRKPRNPLLRIVFGLVGVALLAVLVVVGVFVGVAMLAGGMLLRLARLRGRPVARAQDARVVEGEYRVVDKSALPYGR